MTTSKKNPIKAKLVFMDIYCGHRYFPADGEFVPNPKDAQSMNVIVKKQREEERVKYE